MQVIAIQCDAREAFTPSGAGTGTTDRAVPIGAGGKRELDRAADEAVVLLDTEGPAPATAQSVKHIALVGRRTTECRLQAPATDHLLHRGPLELGAGLGLVTAIIHNTLDNLSVRQPFQADSEKYKSAWKG